MRQLRVLAHSLIENYKISGRRACMLVQFSRAALHYKYTSRDDTAVRERIKEIAKTNIRYGADRIHTVLKREGWPDNHKRVRRVYREEGLNLRNKRSRRSKSAAHRLERPQLTDSFQCWSMDFVYNQLYDGKKFRSFTIVDNYSRFCLSIIGKKTFTGITVARSTLQANK